MFKDPKNNFKFSIKKNATGKLLQTFDGKFRVLVFPEEQDILGRGGFGRCFMGILENQQITIHSFIKNEEPITHTNSKPSYHSIVVVKEIRKNKQKHNQEEYYFRQIQNLSLVTNFPESSRNLVKCHPFVLDSMKNYYIVMEYCDGRSLDKLIKRRLREASWFTFFQFLKIFIDIINGYYPLDKYGIIHEDLKPQNLLIKGRNFKIGDFGLSFQLKEKQSVGRGGSCLYNGIEKYLRKQTKISNKSDMYAIGIILHELFYGLHPYFQKQDLQKFKAKQIYRLMTLRENKSPEIKLTHDQNRQLFIQFYSTRVLRERKPLIKIANTPPHLMTLWGETINNLYHNAIPLLIKKLVDKDINNRPTFMNVRSFIQQNKIQEILKCVQEIKNKKPGSICFFEELTHEPETHIRLQSSFEQLTNKICHIKRSEINRESLDLQNKMNQTVGSNNKKKLILSRKYPRVMGLKSTIEKINSLSRFLMSVEQQLEELNYNPAIHHSSSNQQYCGVTQTNDKQRLLQEQKKVELEQLIQRYLLSFLILVTLESEEQIKSFNQSQVAIYYEQNVDLMLKLVYKNKEYLESEMLIGENDFLDMPAQEKLLRQKIQKQFLYDFLDDDNLILFYYCLFIFRTMSVVENLKQQLLWNKQLGLKKQQMISNKQIRNSTELGEEMDELETIKQEWQQVIVKHQISVQQLKSIVIKDLENFGIEALIMIDID